MEVCSWDAVVAAQVPLCLVPEVFGSIDMNLPSFNKLFRVINPLVMEFRDIKDIIGAEWVRIYDAIWLNFIANNAHQRG